VPGAAGSAARKSVDFNDYWQRHAPKANDWHAIRPERQLKAVDNH